VAPTVALPIQIVGAIVVALAAKSERLDFGTAGRDYFRVFLVWLWIVAPVWLTSRVGYALSVLIFSFGLAVAAEFRDLGLLTLRFGTSITMVLRLPDRLRDLVSETLAVQGPESWKPLDWLSMFETISLGLEQLFRPIVLTSLQGRWRHWQNTSLQSISPWRHCGR